MTLPADLARLPLLTKAELRSHGKDLIASATSGPRISTTTSGTTGSPVALHQNLEAVNWEHAFIWRQLSWAGLKPGDRRAWIRGDPIVPVDAREGPFWRENKGDSMLMMSSYHLSDANARAYLDALERYDPTVVQAYPSAMTFLASWMDNNGATYRGRSLKGIVTSSEAITSDERALIHRQFGVTVFDWYGLTERVAAIGTCEHGRYHVMTDYGHMEFTPADDGLHTFCGTGYHNLVMPLIRYSCGDLVRLAAKGERCGCGRSFPLVDEIFGRVDDAIKLPDGRRIAACLAAHVFRNIPGVLQGQIRQDHRDRLDLYVVPGPAYREESSAKLRGETHQRVGGSMAVEVHLVDELPRTARGKFQAVVCTV